jgi:uncharacterized cupin superfamily protein
MSEISHVRAAAAEWKHFTAEDATHPQLEGLSNDIGSSALWLHKRDDSSERPSQSGLYRMAVGEFDFVFPGDQTSYVLEGAATIVLEDSRTIEVRAGDMVFWPKGTTCRWSVTEKWTEFFTMIG